MGSWVMGTCQFCTPKCRS